MTDHSLAPYTWERLSEALKDSDGAAYILHLDRFRQNLASLVASFQARYAHVGVGYSYKTNYLPRLCREADYLGAYAEVVSGMEYEMARSLGVPGGRIIFNGPAKSGMELERAFSDGALVNVDSLSEASLIAGMANEFAGTIRLGLRCNLDFSWNGRESRFGLSESSDELAAAWDLLSQCVNVRLEGLHCHTSFSRSASSYERRITRLIELSDSLFQDVTPRFLNVGGGLCGPMPASLASQLNENAPAYADYAEAICTPMRDRYGDDGPELIVEPGVGLVGDVFDYAYRVEHIKKVGGRHFAITSGASHHIKIVPNKINLPTIVYHDPANGDRPLNTDNSPIDVVGYTCLEHDVIYRSLDAHIDRGDILVTSSSGAYSVVASPDFIRTTPMVIELDSAGCWRTLRRKNTTGDLMALFTW